MAVYRFLTYNCQLLSLPPPGLSNGLREDCLAAGAAPGGAEEVLGDEVPDEDPGGEPPAPESSSSSRTTKLFLA